MRRRIQITGGSTYIISLPKEWVKSYNLGKGSEVDVEVLPNGDLIVRPIIEQAGRHEDTVSLPMEDNIWATIRKLISYYIAGVSQISIKIGQSYDHKSIHMLKDFVSRRIMGLEIVEESSNELLFQVTVSDDAIPIQTSLKRLTRIILNMLVDIKISIKNESPDPIIGIESRDDIVDRFYLYIARQLTQVLRGKIRPYNIGVNSLMEADLYKFSAKNLERIGDHTVIMSNSIQSLYGPSSGHEISCMKEPLLLMLSNTIDLFQETSTTFLSLDSEKADTLIEEAMTLRRVNDEESNKVICIRSPESYYHARRILESLKRVTDYSIDILETVINMSIIKELEVNTTIK